MAEPTAWRATHGNSFFSKLIKPVEFDALAAIAILPMAKKFVTTKKAVNVSAQILMMSEIFPFLISIKFSVLHSAQRYRGIRRLTYIKYPKMPPVAQQEKTSQTIC